MRYRGHAKLMIETSFQLKTLHLLFSHHFLEVQGNPSRNGRHFELDALHPRIEGTPSKAASNSSWLMKWSLSRSMYPKMSRNIDILCDGKCYPHYLPSGSLKNLGTGCRLGREISAKMMEHESLNWNKYERRHDFYNSISFWVTCRVGGKGLVFDPLFQGSIEGKPAPLSTGPSRVLENEGLEAKNLGLEDYIPFQLDDF